jgi:hypothetical protein
MKHQMIFFKISLASLLILLSQTHCRAVMTEISFGELIDKITILTIKSKRITDPNKLKNVLAELELLRDTFSQYIGNRADIATLAEELYINNELQWDMEDIFRAKEKVDDFGDEFIANARSIRVSNDRRCLIKKKIDEILGSRLTEEKSYDELG